MTLAACSRVNTILFLTKSAPTASAAVPQEGEIIGGGGTDCDGESGLPCPTEFDEYMGLFTFIGAENSTLSPLRALDLNLGRNGELLPPLEARDRCGFRGCDEGAAGAAGGVRFSTDSEAGRRLVSALSIRLTSDPLGEKTEPMEGGRGGIVASRPSKTLDWSLAQLPGTTGAVGALPNTGS